MDAHPFNDPDHPLRFRGIPDSLANFHLEGSECCLVHADNHLSSARGVWLNPNVRVGYSGTAYDAMNDPQRPLSSYDILVGLWGNRFKRWFTTLWFKDWMVQRRLKKWKAGDPARRDEPGPFCLINEMQVLVANGWAHV